MRPGLFVFLLLIGSNVMAAKTPLVVGVWKDERMNPTGILIARPDGTAHNHVEKDGNWRATSKTGYDFIITYQNGNTESVKISRDKNSLSYFSGGQPYTLVRDSYPSRNQDGPAGSTQRAKKIPADAVKYKGNYYLAVPMNRTHGGAMDYCKRLGGHLVRINNASEQAFVARLARGSGLPKCWIDGSDAYKENEWLFSDGIRMSFFPWAPGQPDHSGNIEHNLVMFASDGYKWHDDAEYHSDRGFICEWEGDDPQTSDGVFLDDLQEVEFRTIYNAVNKHGNGSNNTVILYNGVKPAHSLYIHPATGQNAFVRYDLNGDYERLRGKVGLASLRKPDGSLSQSDKSASPVIFKVFGDDELLWESKPIQAYGPWLDCDVSVEGVNNLVLTTEALNENFSAHATWIMPELKSAIKNGGKQSKTRPEEPIKKLSPKHAKRVLDDANLWEGKPGVWYLKRANNFATRVYERLSKSSEIRSALRAVNGRLPTKAEMNNPPSRR